MKHWRVVVLLLVVAVALTACGFAGARNPTYGPPGFFHGVWDGLIAPWGLALRLFVRIGMYAVPNTGWFYDAGFLLGVAGSIPIGWLAALIALGVHLAG
jgi:hypothetical protein